MTDHCRCLDRGEMAVEWERLLASQTEHPPQVFEVISPRVTTKSQCPFPWCLRSYCNWRFLRNYFNRKHWRDSLLILEEDPSLFPHCEQCGCQNSPWLLNSQHYTLEQFKIGQVHRR